mmetsp:Transcript_30418/g.65809  ORF Transcript_30418/g.65809 Transcript_30418/m.65809 type:complete len:87 (+) Transcript_30418:509-769(+)
MLFVLEAHAPEAWNNATTLTPFLGHAAGIPLHLKIAVLNKLRSFFNVSLHANEETCTTTPTHQCDNQSTYPSASSSIQDKLPTHGH